LGQPVSPVNITAAALIIQFSLAVIFALGAIFLRAERQHYIFRDSTSSGFSGIILAFSLVTIGLLFFTDEFSSVWKPLFQGIDFSGFNWSIALLLVFIFNIAWVTIMVAMSGGSTISAFSPLYFILPALAIFLRESLLRIIIYLAITCAFFTWNFSLKIAEFDDKRSFPRLAFWLVSIASLILTTLIGYVTRPR
jgi:hypothetical protein